MQTSFNLALGSAMASIGLTIPVIAVATIWLEGPLVLGLGATQMCCWRSRWWSPPSPSSRAA